MSLHNDLNPETMLARVRAGCEPDLGPLLKVYRNYTSRGHE
jgi:hypothetical protein